MTTPSKTIERMQDMDLKGKRVLIREDLNVPVKSGQVMNDTRIVAALPALKMAIDAGAKLMVMSHLGRPDEGKPISAQPESSLAPVAEHLQKLLGVQVRLVQDYLQDPSAAEPLDGEMVLLENVRVNVGENANADELSQQYAALCDIFVMDAFGTAHRAQASTHGVAKFAPKAVAGPLLAAELDAQSSCRPAVGRRIGCLGQSVEEPGAPHAGHCWRRKSVQQTAGIGESGCKN